MSRKPTPRIAGRRLLALSRVFRLPGVGEQVARVAVREMLVRPLRRKVQAHAELRSVIPFRAQPRRADHD